MIAASHPPVNQVMTAHPRELLHMDTVGPSRVMSVGGKWYVLVIVYDFSRYSWVFFMRTKDEAFEFVRDLILRLKNEVPRPCERCRTLVLTPFAVIKDLNTNILLPILYSRMEL